MVTFAKPEEDRADHSQVSNLSNPDVVVVGDGDTVTSVSTGATTSNKVVGDRNHNGTLGEANLRCMRRSRIMILSLLLLSAGVAGGLTYYFTSQNEQENFEAEVNQYSLYIEEAVQQKAENLFGVMNTMAVTIQSYAKSTSDTEWPYETIPYYQTVATRFRTVTETRVIAMAPLVVGEENRIGWENYSIANQGWVQDSYKQAGWPSLQEPLPIPGLVYDINRDGQTVEATGEMTLPLWQLADPPKDTGTINYNLLSFKPFRQSFATTAVTSTAQLSEVVDASEVLGGESQEHPESLFIQPVLRDDESLSPKVQVVAALVAVLPWDMFMSNLYHSPDTSAAMVGVVNNTCGQTFTYQLNGKTANYLGEGDLHDTSYDYLVHYADITPPPSTDGVTVSCQYVMAIYPTAQLEASSTSYGPVLFAVVIIVLFVSATICFLGYDHVVQKRQRETMQEAARSNAIVSSLFPAEIRDRLFQGEDDIANSAVTKPGKYIGSGKDHTSSTNEANDKGVHEAQKFRLKNFLDDEADNDDGKSGSLTDKGVILESKPIADLFPNTTVLFADIAGFTAWSSVREPAQVFTLLETVYKAFDKTAKHRRVFKVETVGDCYVAVTGLPEPAKDHALVMCRFARECLTQFRKLATQLEVILGPDTGDLAMRIGLHSGPVTAGVLRGDKSRFQLFGDTVNTAARIESTGQRNKIHISHETAELLHKAGKSNWMTRRNETVFAKGKGEMQTYWLATDEDLESGANTETSGSKAAAPLPVVNAMQPRLAKTTTDVLDPEASLPPRIKRLVDWNVDVLKRLLKQIVAKRNADTKEQFDLNHPVMMMNEVNIGSDTYVLSEVTEIVRLPGYKILKGQENPNKIELPPQVEAQLRLYVSSIAAMYRDNPFHNFEHASHVMMSVSKLLSRIVAPDEVLQGDDTHDMMASSLHDHTYGITSDPLTQFSVVLSALIHDVDHCGVSNFQLIKEESKIAAVFKNKSVAEQNSIVLAWDRLMESRFTALRGCIYSDPEELKRFRQLMVNTVMATDIFDKELGALRKARWDTAFRHISQQVDSTPQDDVNRKATIVIEHLIQASDVAHTMQHWHIYQKWNERLFAEMSYAYISGRMDNNPADSWYQGELGFFDNYVIPLAKKLKECGVFGVSSDEYLNYAFENRREWATKGEEAVAKMIEKYYPKQEHPENATEGAATTSTTNIV